MSEAHKAIKNNSKSEERIIVDSDDYERFKDYNWHVNNKGYVVGWYPDVNGVMKPQLMHNILLPRKDGFQTDHINRNRTDNRKENLRYVTAQQNCWNRKSQSNSTSKYKGVCKVSDSTLWRATICYEGKCYSLGCYADEYEAALEYSTMAKLLFGEHAFVGWEMY